MANICECNYRLYCSDQYDDLTQLYTWLHEHESDFCEAASKLLAGTDCKLNGADLIYVEDVSGDHITCFDVELDSRWTPPENLWGNLCNKLGLEHVEFTAYYIEQGCGIFELYDPKEVEYNHATTYYFLDISCDIFDCYYDLCEIEDVQTAWDSLISSIKAARPDLDLSGFTDPLTHVVDLNDFLDENCPDEQHWIVISPYIIVRDRC